MRQGASLGMRILQPVRFPLGQPPGLATVFFLRHGRAKLTKPETPGVIGIVRAHPLDRLELTVKRRPTVLPWVVTAGQIVTIRS